jgi:hypothetical protein
MSLSHDDLKVAGTLQRRHRFWRPSYLPTITPPGLSDRPLALELGVWTSMNAFIDCGSPRGCGLLEIARWNTCNCLGRVTSRSAANAAASSSTAAISFCQVDVQYSTFQVASCISSDRRRSAFGASRRACLLVLLR